LLRRPNVPLELPAHYTARTFFGLVDANQDDGVDESDLGAAAERLKPIMSGPTV
jgi:hypothetical protein